MLTVLNATAPIYLLIALGFVAVRFDWMLATDIGSLGRFVARFGLPALLFRAIASQPLANVFDARYLVVYAGGSLAAMLAIRTIAFAVRRRPGPLAALQGLGSSCSNSAFVGYPIVVQIIGPVAGTALALCSLVENILMIPLGLALADASPTGHSRAWRSQTAGALRGLLRNPMFIGIIAGVIAAALQLKLPSPLERGIALLAGVAPATALFVIGGSLVGLQLGDMHGDVALVTIGKLCVHPLCVFVFVLLLPPAEPALRAAAVLYAAMPMLSILPILAQRHGYAGFAAAALLTVIVTSFFTIGSVIALLRFRPGRNPAPVSLEHRPMKRASYSDASHFSRQMPSAAAPYMPRAILRS